jgi:hypothetical protein
MTSISQPPLDPRKQRHALDIGATCVVRGASLGPAACAPWCEVAQTALDFMKRCV